MPENFASDLSRFCGLLKAAHDDAAAACARAPVKNMLPLYALLDALAYLSRIFSASAEGERLARRDLEERLTEARREFVAALEHCGLAPDDVLLGRLMDLRRQLQAEISALLDASPFKGDGVARPAPDAAGAINASPPVSSHRWLAPGSPGMIEGSDEVLFGASAPDRVVPGDQFLARFVVYLPQDEVDARQILGQDDAGKRLKLTRKPARLLRGTPVRVVLASAHFEIEDSGKCCARDFVWDGETHDLEFAVSVPGDLKVAKSLLRFGLSIDGVPLSLFNFELQVGAQKAAARHQQTGARIPERAFASYASKDRQRVLDRVAAIRIAAGIEVFLDCIDLFPSERWKPRLEKEIREREMFMLFWSEAAAGSHWVTWEWEQALAKENPLEHMQMQPLDYGLSPPRVLKDIHGGDFLMALRLADAVTREKREREKQQPGPSL